MGLRRIVILSLSFAFSCSLSINTNEQGYVLHDRSCSDLELKWNGNPYDPNVEAGAEFTCQSNDEGQGAATYDEISGWVISPNNMCHLRCDGSVFVTFECKGGEWTNQPLLQQGLWCYVPITSRIGKESNTQGQVAEASDSQNLGASQCKNSCPQNHGAGLFSEGLCSPSFCQCDESGKGTLQECPNPELLAFNEESQQCDYKRNLDECKVCAIVYKDFHFQSSEKTIAPGDEVDCLRSEEDPSWNDAISSVRVREGCTLHVESHCKGYTDANFWEKDITGEYNMSPEENEKVSLYKCQCGDQKSLMEESNVILKETKKIDAGEINSGDKAALQNTIGNPNKYVVSRQDYMLSLWGEKSVDEIIAPNSYKARIIRNYWWEWDSTLNDKSKTFDALSPQLVFKGTEPNASPTIIEWNDLKENHLEGRFDFFVKQRLAHILSNVRKVVMVVHGFIDGNIYECQNTWVAEMAQKIGDYENGSGGDATATIGICWNSSPLPVFKTRSGNLCMLGRATNLYYPEACSTGKVGELLAKMVSAMKNVFPNIEYVHGIGHSLGLILWGMCITSVESSLTGFQAWTQLDPALRMQWETFVSCSSSGD